MSNKFARLPSSPLTDLEIANFDRLTQGRPFVLTPEIMALHGRMTQLENAGFPATAKWLREELNHMISAANAIEREAA